MILTQGINQQRSFRTRKIEEGRGDDVVDANAQITFNLRQSLL